MPRHFSKRIVILAAAALIAGFGSYSVGFAGVNPGQLITEGRCRAGAFLGRVDPLKNLQADAPDANNSSQSTLAETDAAFTTNHPVALTGGNLFANPGVETLDGSAPAGWSNNKTGDNDAAFSQVLGHDSGRGLRIDITKFKDGTADWFTGFAAVQAGGYYQYSDFYRSNVPTHATLSLKDAKGNVKYLSLGTVPASAVWAPYSVRFFVPANVSQVLVSHTLDQPGALETDDYALQRATPQGFSEPLVSVTFDDGWSSIHQNALPIMKKYQIVSTQYVISGILGTPGHFSSSAAYDFRNSGHEIASHTLTHPDLTKVSDKQLNKELAQPQNGITKCYNDATDFAAPYGAYDVHTTAAVAKLYQTARSTDTGLNSADHFNPYELKVINVRSDTTADQLQAWLDAARANNAWVILVYHQVDAGGGPYSRPPAKFEQDMRELQASGIKIKTVHDAYTEIQPQIKH